MRNSRDEIVDFIRKTGQARPFDLVRHLAITPQAVHRQLKRLVSEKKLRKVGLPPHVFYLLVSPELKLWRFGALDPIVVETIERNYLYVSPSGEIIEGLAGFQQWVLHTKQQRAYPPLASAYVDTVAACEKCRNTDGLINAFERIEKIIPNHGLDAIVYYDFYSVPQFGKTRAGHLVSLGKSGQSLAAVHSIAGMIGDLLKKFAHSFDAVAWVPHSSCCLI